MAATFGTPVSRAAFLRAWTLPAMVGALAAYAIVHRPLLGAVTWALFTRASNGPLVGNPGFRFTPSVTTGAVVATVGAALTAGGMVARRLAVETYETPVVFGVVAFASIAIPAALLGSLAAAFEVALLTPPLGPILVSLPALALAVLAWRRPPRGGTKGSRLPGGGALAGALGCIAVALLAASAMTSTMRPPSGFDALSYHAPMAVYFWRDGNIVSLLDRAPWGFAQAHPGAAELWLGLLLAGFGERIANLGQLPFAALGSAAIHAFCRRLGFRHRAALVAASAFLVAPMVVLQAGIQVNDVTAAALIMGAVALACGAVEHALWRAGLVGLALGLAVTVKLAVLPAAGAVMTTVAVITLRRAADWRRAAAAVGVLVVVFAITVMPWAARNVILFGNPAYPAAVPFLSRGIVVGKFEKKDTRFVPAAIAWPLYPLVEAHSDESGVGPLFLIAALPGLLIAAVMRRPTRPVLLFAVMSVTSIVAWWFLTQHEPRHLLAVFGLAFGFVPWTLLAVPRRWRTPAAACLVVAAIVSALVTVDRGLAPRLAAPADRARFYDQVWGVDPVVASWDPAEPLVYNTGYASLSYAGDYPLLGPALRRVLLTVDTAATTDDIVRFMRDQGARYAYVPASVRWQRVVETKYARDAFDIAHVSVVESGKLAGTRRYLFRLRSPSRSGADAAARAVAP